MDEDIELQMYRKTAEALICSLLPDSPTATSSRTESIHILTVFDTNGSFSSSKLTFTVISGGLIWVSEWNSLLHPVASAFLTVIFSDYMSTAQVASLYCRGKFYSAADLRDFARSQVRNVLS